MEVMAQLLSLDSLIRRAPLSRVISSLEITGDSGDCCCPLLATPEM
jgi:hypothetical protein